MYRDFDEPEGEVQAKVTSKPLINFLDIWFYEMTNYQARLSS